MLRILKTLLLFQKRIVIISYPIAIVIGMVFGGKLQTIGISFAVISLLMHYFVYEIYENEYYFYFNIGFTKSTLWVSTLVLAFIHLLLFSIV